jgi:hypothetical protein
MLFAGIPTDSSKRENNIIMPYTRFATLAFAILVFASLSVPFATATTYTTTPIADGSIGSLPTWPNSDGQQPLCWNNEGGWYDTMVGQIGPLDSNWYDKNGVGYGMDLRCFQRYDVSALAGIPNLRVDSISLTVYSIGSNYDPFWSQNNNQVTLHPEIHPISRANGDWVEGAGDPVYLGDGVTPVDGATCWNAKDTASTYYDAHGVRHYTASAREPWAGSPGLHTPDVDYDSTLTAKRTLTKSDLDPPPGQTVKPITFNFTGTSAQMTDLIDSWLDDYANNRPNPGLVFMNIVENDDFADLNQRLQFYSKHSLHGPGDPDGGVFHPEWLPKLTINYSVVPEPSTIVLLACGLISLAVFARRKSQ